MFRAQSDDWPVWALAVDLGIITTTPSRPAVFTVGHIRDPVALFTGASGVEERHPYFMIQYAVEDIVSRRRHPDHLLTCSQPAFVLGDAENAMSVAAQFDADIEAAARNVSNEYFEIVALSVLQSLGATELTVGKRGDGSWNTDRPMLFVKGQHRRNPAMKTHDIQISLILEYDPFIILRSSLILLDHKRCRGDLCHVAAVTLL